MKHTKTRLFCLLLAVLMLISLTACGKDKTSADPNLLKIGDYTLLYKGAYITEDYEGNDAIVLTLDYTNNSKSNDSYLWSIVETATQNGEDLDTTTVYTNYETFDTVMGSQLEEAAPGATLEVQTAFALKDTTSPIEVTFFPLLGSKEGKITIDPSTLSRETVPDATGSSGAASPETGDALLDWWNGEWYGWWMMEKSTGIYEHLDGYWWDICADIAIEEDNLGTVTLWDEDYSRDEPMAYVVARLSEDGLDEHGTLYSEGGWFMASDITSSDWTVAPSLAGMFKGYENVLCISGRYVNGEDGFEYTIYLRPWGQLWDDIAAEYPDDIPWFYDDWYLPLIDAGETMPDKINEIQPDEGYGLSNPEATGEATLEDMRAVLSILVGWDVDCDYAKAREMLGSDGVPWRELETTWNVKKHCYLWENADGDFLCIAFKVEDGQEIYSSCTYSDRVSDGII